MQILVQVIKKGPISPQPNTACSTYPFTLIFTRSQHPQPGQTFWNIIKKSLNYPPNSTRLLHLATWIPDRTPHPSSLVLSICDLSNQRSTNRTTWRLLIGFQSSFINNQGTRLNGKVIKGWDWAKRKHTPWVGLPNQPSSSFQDENPKLLRPSISGYK